MNIINMDNCKRTNLLVEQHFHGCYGIDFSTCETQDILNLSKIIIKHGIGGFFPTLVTDNIKNIKRQISRIKEAKSLQTSEMADILGIHLEGIFINPEKKGIHDEKLFLEPTIENYKKIEDDFIKIVTLAPELDKNCELRKYLLSNNIKVQAGHCIGGDLSYCNATTHTFNAMSGISHRTTSTALSALVNDNLYCEIIADGIHLNDDIVDLVFKSKPKDKVILVSDSLPIAQSELKQMDFAGQTIYYDGEKATSKTGTLAGSTTVLNQIVKRLSLLNPNNFEYYVNAASKNVYDYHNLNIDGYILWDENFNIKMIEKGSNVHFKET